MRRTFTGDLSVKYRVMLPIVERLPVQADLQRYRVQTEAIRRFDVRGQLSKIASPTLVISAGADVLTTPAWGRELAASIPGSRYVTIDRAGHAAYEQQKRQFDSAVHDFLHDR